MFRLPNWFRRNRNEAPPATPTARIHQGRGPVQGRDLPQAHRVPQPEPVPVAVAHPVAEAVAVRRASTSRRPPHEAIREALANPERLERVARALRDPESHRRLVEHLFADPEFVRAFQSIERSVRTSERAARARGESVRERREMQRRPAPVGSQRPRMEEARAREPHPRATPPEDARRARAEPAIGADGSSRPRLEPQ